MSTTYGKGVDGAQVMAKTAEKFQEFLRHNGLGDETAVAVDLDMLEVKISGMAARALMTHWKDIQGIAAQVRL